jgi:hypothetical protein
MKLHANAKLGPKGRLVICQRVTEQGFSLKEAAEAAGVSERTASKWLVWPLPPRGRDRPGGPQLRAALRAAPNPSRPSRGDRRPAPPADDRPRDRGVPGDGALHRLGGADPDRVRKAQRPGAAQPLRASPPGRVDPHRRQEAGQDRQGRRAPHHRQPPPRPALPGSAGSSSTSASMTPPASPT